VARHPVVYRERLISEAGFWSIGKEEHDTPLETDGGDYEAGQVCPYGVVRTVRGRMAYIAGWDGEAVIVVAVKDDTSHLREDRPVPVGGGGGGAPGLFGGGKGQ
jgi:hypothetical protein